MHHMCLNFSKETGRTVVIDWTGLVLSFEVNLPVWTLYLYLSSLIYLLPPTLYLYLSSLIYLPLRLQFCLPLP